MTKIPHHENWLKVKRINLKHFAGTPCIPEIYRGTDDLIEYGMVT